MSILLFIFIHSLLKSCFHTNPLLHSITDSSLSSLPSDVTETPPHGYHSNHAHGTYLVLIIVLITLVVLLISSLVLLILCFYCCPHWLRRHKAAAIFNRSRDHNTKNSHKISHFTQTNGSLKKPRPKSMNADYLPKGGGGGGGVGVIGGSFLQDSQLQGITNTQMNEYTVLPGVLNNGGNPTGVMNEYSTIPALPPSTHNNDYATLNGLHSQINEYTPLTREESSSESRNPSQEKMWRYSSAEDKTNKVFLDFPDICDTAGNRKSL